MSSDTYKERYLTPNSVYVTFYPEWSQNQKSYHGGITYRHSGYLRAYAVDAQTPSETITTYDYQDGQQVGIHRGTRVSAGTTGTRTHMEGGSFYGEKIANVPVYNYVKLIVSEYNSILFRNPVTRILPDTAQITEFANNCDGHGNSLDEFMSQVDIATTVNGVSYVMVTQADTARLPRFRSYTPDQIYNWEYQYDDQGDLKLCEVLIHKVVHEDYDQYLKITLDEYVTIWCRSEHSDDWRPDIEGVTEVEDGIWEYREPNSLGYIPLVPVYQNQPIKNGVGNTPISDISQIQRSIYGDCAEIYSAITYSAHPSLVVDTTTHQLNQGEIGAEPGSIVMVDNTLTGESNHVYEFIQPTLDAITEIRDLIDNKIDKITQTAMIRSDDLIRTANSGVQVEMLDDKLNALIKKKATNMENSEQKLWKIFADYTNTQNFEYLVSYPRNYNKKGLTEEITEINGLLDVVAKYQAMAGNVAIDSDVMDGLTAKLTNIIEQSYSQNAR